MSSIRIVIHDYYYKQLFRICEHANDIDIVKCLLCYEQIDGSIHMNILYKETLTNVEEWIQENFDIISNNYTIMPNDDNAIERLRRTIASLAEDPHQRRFYCTSIDNVLEICPYKDKHVKYYHNMNTKSNVYQFEIYEYGKRFSHYCYDAALKSNNVYKMGWYITHKNGYIVGYVCLHKKISEEEFREWFSKEVYSNNESCLVCIADSTTIDYINSCIDDIEADSEDHWEIRTFTYP